MVAVQRCRQRETVVAGRGAAVSDMSDIMLGEKRWRMRVCIRCQEQVQNTVLREEKLEALKVVKAYAVAVHHNEISWFCAPIDATR